MDPDVIFKKCSRASFCVSRKSECTSTSEARSSTTEDEISDELQSIIARITLPDMKLYESHIHKLNEEEEAIKNEYHRAKLALELSGKIDGKVTYTSSAECEKFLTDEDKSFLQKKPDYMETIRQMNNLMSEITLLAHKKSAIIKTTRNCDGFITNRILALKKSFGKFILESDNFDSDSSENTETDDGSCLVVEEILTNVNV